MAETEEEAIAEQVLAGTDGIVVPAGLVDEPPRTQPVEKSLLQRVATMTVSERIKLALHGNREARALLLRDSNKLIRRFVLKNPRVNDDEIIAVAKNRSA